MDNLVAVGLEAVIVAVTDDEPRVLTVERDGLAALPAGTLEDDSTLDRAVRRFTADQTGIEVGYAEQLYTFGDKDRETDQGRRRLSIAYLALVAEERPSPGARWRSLYEHLPWEDHRAGRPVVLDELLLPLQAWAEEDTLRRERAALAFGIGDAPWDPVKSLERYELLYEAGLVAEHHHDQSAPSPPLPASSPMALDHRRIAATALGRLRGKLTYRPVVFELLPARFTLLMLQQVVEALVGQPLHKQNFRRLVERSGLVAGTGATHSGGVGRPAELFEFRREVLFERPRPGVHMQGLR